MSQDLDQLRILSVFHYVVAVLAGLFSLFPILHLGMGLAMLGGAFGPQRDEVPLRLVGGFFVAFAGLWILLGLAFAVCLGLAGRFLGEQRRYSFCLVMAAVACVFVPFGTVLGVFTLIVLLRDSVKSLFDRPPAAPA